MSRNQREPRRTRVNSPSRLPSLSFSVRALIWVDMEPLLKMERARCERASEQLRSVTEKLDQFDREVSSAFSIWLHTHFGEALTHVRELHAKMEELEDQVSWVHYEAMRAGISERTAYERLARLRASGENDGGRSPTEDDADSEEFDELLRGAFEELAGPASQFDPEQYDELLGEFREQFRERLADPAQGQFQEEPSHFHRSSSPRSEHSGGDESEKRRKQLYRDLARKLHPDHNASITAESKELWHEVQDAYESKDLDRLEALAAMSEGGREHRFSQFCSVSKLRSVLVDFQNKLAAAKKAIKEAKKDPAWDFLAVQRNPSRLAMLARKLGRELEDDRESLALEVERLEARVSRWKRGKKTKK